MMSFTKKQRETIMKRDGHRCIPCHVMFGYCNAPESHLVIHHRANRGMGGSKALNVASNGVTCCSEQNQALESSAFAAAVARENGWKIPSNGVLRPDEIGMRTIDQQGRLLWVMLDNEGGQRPVYPPQGGFDG